VIVDCYTHIWQSPDQLGRAIDAVIQRLQGAASGAASPPTANTGDHLAAAEPVDITFVFGFKSHYLAAEVPNQFISAYVKEHSRKMVGVAGVDPAKPKEAIEEIRRSHGEFGLKAATISPAAQDFHPADTHAMGIYAVLADCHMPVFINNGLGFTAESKMEFARPHLLDEIAREFPELKIIIGQMGYPWVDEALVLLSKHKNVLADISGLIELPWIAYNALVRAHQQGVMNKLLFGSDFPYNSAADCIESLYGLNHTGHGTNLPTIPREHLRSIIELDALESLGMPLPVPVRIAETSLLSDDEA